MLKKTLQSLILMFFVLAFLNLPIPKASADIVTSLIGQWKFDEGSGTTASDSSGNGAAGTLMNGPLWTTGKIGNGAISFDGVDDVVNIGTNNLYNFTTSDFSIAFWINPTSSATDEIIVSRGAWQTDGYSLYFTSTTGNFKMETYQAGALQAITPNNSLPFGSWSHVVFVRSGTTGRIYINGTEVTYARQDAIINPASSARALGFMSNAAGPSAGNSSAGSMDEVRIYNRALTAADVTELFNYSGVSGDTTPPTVSISSPTAGATVSSSTTVSANAADNVAVAGVQFKLDGVNLGAEDTTNPYSVVWDTTTASNSSHTLTAVARDTSNNVTTSSSVTVTVSNAVTPPPPPPPSPTPPPPPSGTVFYYVDAGRSTNGNGSAASPWKLRSDINWTTVSNTLATNPVTIYFSSRSRWDDAGALSIGASGSASFPLVIDGHSKYNTVASGTAVWQDETTLMTNSSCTAGRAAFGSATNNSGAIYFGMPRSFVTLYGICMDHPKYGIVLGDNSGGHKMHDIHDITLENNYVDSPQDTTGGAQGIYSGGVTYNSYNWNIRYNTIIKSKQEAIYVGEYNWFAGAADDSTDHQCSTAPGGVCADSITGVIVEYNTIVDSGQTDEGDIDIKPGVKGAIIRYNTSYSVTGAVLGGIVMAATDFQVYGNQLYNLRPRNVGDGGNGIEINADGACDNAGCATGGAGRPIANGLLYNNLFYGDYTAGIHVIATRTATGTGTGNASITNLRILNNTVVGTSNGPGLLVSSSNSRPITISLLENNIFSNNTSYEVSLSGTASITTSDYNILWHPATGTGGVVANYLGSNKTWAQWQALGFDSHGKNQDPSLNPSYAPQTGSPAIDAGISQSSLFTADIAGTSRPQGSTWDIGAYEIVPSGATPLVGDINLDHIVNSIDYSILNAHWFQNYAPADFNSDGIVNSLDYSMMNANWFKTW